MSFASFVFFVPLESFVPFVFFDSFDLFDIVFIFESSFFSDFVLDLLLLSDDDFSLLLILDISIESVSDCLLSDNFDVYMH